MLQNKKLNNFKERVYLVKSFYESNQYGEIMCLVEKEKKNKYKQFKFNV